MYIQRFDKVYISGSSLLWGHRYRCRKGVCNQRFMVKDNFPWSQRIFHQVRFWPCPFYVLLRPSRVSSSSVLFPVLKVVLPRGSPVLTFWHFLLYILLSWHNVGHIISYIDTPQVWLYSLTYLYIYVLYLVEKESFLKVNFLHFPTSLYLLVLILWFTGNNVRSRSLLRSTSDFNHFFFKLLFVLFIRVS